MSAAIYRTETSKPVNEFIQDFTAIARGNGFLIHNEDKMEMAHVFGVHGVAVAAGFDLHMVQICKPAKAAKSLSKNPERAILMPKFVMVFSQEGKTAIRMLRFSAAQVAELVDDAEFPASIVESFEHIVTAIEAAR